MNDNSARPAATTDYEVIGPGVFRFEYFYLFKNGRVTDWPWDRFDYSRPQNDLSTHYSSALAR